MISVLLTLSLSLAVSPQPQTQTGARSERGADPVVSMSAPPSSDHIRADIRHARDKRANASHIGPLKEPKENDAFGGGIAEDQQWLPALPLKESDAIIVGAVKSAVAHLSEQKDFVYTEFQIEVGQVLRSSTSISAGDVIDTYRMGGAVRFPSGKTWHFRTYGQGFPEPGQRFLLFLRPDPSTNDFDIVTGYEFRAGKVIPLDFSGTGRGSEKRFQQYQGMDENSFLDVVRKAIAGGTLQ